MIRRRTLGQAALASTACQVPPESSVPFHDMPENLVDGMGKARYFHTVLEGTPVLVRTREGRPILVAPRATETSGRGLTVRHQAALMRAIVACGWLSPPGVFHAITGLPSFNACCPAINTCRAASPPFTSRSNL